MLSVAVRYWLACRTIRSRSWFLAQPGLDGRDGEHDDGEQHGDEADEPP